MIATDVALAAGSGMLALHRVAEQPPLWALYAVAAFMSAVNGLQRPSLDAFAPRLVDKDEIPAAAALSAVRGSVGMIAGPALAGILLATVGLPVHLRAPTRSHYLRAGCFALIRVGAAARGRRAAQPGRRSPKASATRAAARS